MTRRTPPPQPEPRLSVRAVHRDEPNLDQLSELLIRLALQRTEHAQQTDTPPRPQTLRPPLSDGPL